MDNINYYVVNVKIDKIEQWVVAMDSVKCFSRLMPFHYNVTREYTFNILLFYSCPFLRCGIEMLRVLFAG